MPRRLSRVIRRALPLALAALAASGCQFKPDPDSDRFQCTTASDCGDGYTCVPQKSPEHLGTSFCWKTTEISAEVCNGLDDDKDGVVDDDPTDLGPCDTGRLGVCQAGSFVCSAGVRSCVGPSPTREICNGLDDDCNGVVDDGFNLQTDPKNCGQCGLVCDAGKVCSGGHCQ